MSDASARVGGPFASFVDAHRAAQSALGLNVPGPHPGSEGLRRLLCRTLEDAGVNLGEYDARIAGWLGGMEMAMVAAVAGWVERAVEAATLAERERIARLADIVGATRTERCHDPAHAQMVHAIRAVGSGGGHVVPFADLLRNEVARRAEELHAEHHPGTFVPSLDSCTEHDRAACEALVRGQLGLEPTP